MLWALASSIPLAIVAGFGAGNLIAGIAGALLTGLVLFHFASLTVELRGDELWLRFGPGWISKRFAVPEIREARAVRNHWFYGWGIRLMPGGWLYNVYGLDAVEIRMTNRRVYRIGTDEPVELLNAVRSAVRTPRCDQLKVT